MIVFKASVDCKTVITWQGEHCEAVVDIGTVDATSAVQLNLLLRKMGSYSDISLEFNEYKCAIVKWKKELYNPRGVIMHDLIVQAALVSVRILKSDVAEYNHHCAIIETADEARAA